ncbi:MAG: Ribonuclease H1 [Cyphobasidiales sp. Tagirdzhanova-0007]|nr:MAG: Ribonuclease H1 [Cyphobasidiales sp. Tagirdzhanova-0007]
MSHGAPESSVSSAVRAKPYASTQLQGHRSATISGNTANLGHAETTGANGWMIVYADGSCIHNGQSGARAGSGVHWSKPPDIGDISERLPGKQTNQCAELYTDQSPERPLVIFTDSKYAINCLCKWIHAEVNWERALKEIEEAASWSSASSRFKRNSNLIEDAKAADISAMETTDIESDWLLTTEEEDALTFTQSF